jgi:hypothetical protein
MTRPEVLDAIRAAVEQAPLEELPILAGALAEAQARLALRINAPNGHGQASNAETVDHNLSALSAAKRLGVSLPYLYKHASEYPFTARIGRPVVFSARGLEVWLRSKRSG